MTTRFGRTPALLARLSSLCLFSLSAAFGGIISLETADVPVAVTSGRDRNGDVAMRPDGAGFVAVFESPDAFGAGVYFQRYDANWQPIEGAIPVNTFAPNDQLLPSVGIDGSGNFVVVWQSFGQDTGDAPDEPGIYARRFRADGTAIDGAEFRVNTTTAGWQSDADVSVNRAGQFVVVFRVGTGSSSICAQSYAAILSGESGQPTTMGGEVVVKAGGSVRSDAPSVVIGDSSPDYIVAFQALGQDSAESDSGIFFQRMASGSRSGAETQVNTTTLGNQQFPDIAMVEGGNFCIVWESDNVDGSGKAIMMRRFDASGAAFSGEIQVNTGITLNNQINAHIASDASQKYLVTWTGEEADGDSIGSDVFYKVYNSSGSVVINESTVSPTTASNDAIETNAVGAINSAGDFVIIFDAGAAGNFDTYLRRFAEDPDVSFAAAASSGNENVNSAIGLVRTGAPYVLANVTTAVQVNRTGGTATSGTDFSTVFPTSVTFPAGSSLATLAIGIADDSLVEPDETIGLAIGTVTPGSAVGQTTHTYTILDNDPASTLSINDVSVTEGNAGTTTLTFTVSLNQATGQTVTVDYATANGTALDGSDYIPVSGTLTFAPGQTSQTVVVTVNGDVLFENDETFFLNLSNASNAGLADGQGEGEILNDDPVPTLTVNDVTLPEGNSAGTGTFTPFIFTVTLSAPSAKTTTVDFATANGNATLFDDDYMQASGTLTFAPGETTQSVTVLVNGDTRVEGGEAFTFQLINPTNATLLKSSGTGTIIDDDAPVVNASTIVIPQAATTLTINGSSFDPVPGNNTVVFNLGAAGTITASTAKSLTVTFTTAPAAGALTAVVTTSGVSSGAPVQVAIVDAVPDLQDDVALVGREQPSVDIDALANDSDAGGDSLTITAVSTPAHGTATIIESGRKIRYEMTGDRVASDTFTYTVTDSNGTTATANVFVGDGPTAQAGSYNGLILPATGTTPSNERAGTVKVTINGATGKFTAKLRLAGQSFTAIGTFGPDGVAKFGKTGEADFAVKRRNASELRLKLQLVLAPTITKLQGELTDGGTPFAVLDAERAFYTAQQNPLAPFENVPANLLGRYTVAFLAKSPVDQGRAADLYPQGHGWGFLTVGKSGSVRLTATLADGTKITSTNTLTNTGRWPFYAAVAGGKGSLSGFVLFRDQPGVSDLDSLDVQWFEPAKDTARYYPKGWADGIRTDLVGSKLVVSPATLPAGLLGLSAPDADGNAFIGFTNGDLAGGGFDKAVNITGQNLATVVSPGADQLVLKFRNTTATVSKLIGAYEDGGDLFPLIKVTQKPASPLGAFRGSFLDASAARATGFYGVILQKQSIGLGFFLGAKGSGAVVLGPR